MTKPKAYDPQEGYRYQIFCRNCEYSRAWDHCDYAKDRDEKDYLIGEYKIAYGPGWEFKYEFLPTKFWPKRVSALGTVLLLLCLLLPQQATARISCTETLTGDVVCVDSESGQTLERREKLTGEVDFIETYPGRDRRRHGRKGRRHDASRD